MVSSSVIFKCYPLAVNTILAEFAAKKIENLHSCFTSCNQNVTS